MNANIGLTNNCGVMGNDNLITMLLLLTCFSPNIMGGNDFMLIMLILLMSTSNCGNGCFNRGVC